MRLLQFLTGPPSHPATLGLGALGDALDAAGELFDAAAACLAEGAPAPADLAAGQARVRAYVRTARRHLLCLPVGPVPGGLTRSPGLLAVLPDIERCGGLARRLAQAADLAGGRPAGAHLDALRALRETVRGLFPQCRAAVLAGDAARARRVVAGHDRAAGAAHALLRALAADDGVVAGHAVALAYAAPLIVRVAEGLARVAEAAAPPPAPARGRPVRDARVRPLHGPPGRSSAG